MNVLGTIFFCFLATVATYAVLQYAPKIRIPARIRAKRARKNFRYIRGGKLY